MTVFMFIDSQEELREMLADAHKKAVELSHKIAKVNDELQDLCGEMCELYDKLRAFEFDLPEKEQK